MFPYLLNLLKRLCFPKVLVKNLLGSQTRRHFKNDAIHTAIEFFNLVSSEKLRYMDESIPMELGEVCWVKIQRHDNLVILELSLIHI